MLRPATPLSILAFVAFVLLLISVLSAPIIKGIKLASYEDVDFGVFGYCKLDRCSGISVGYDPDHKLDKGKPIRFSLPPNTRHSLSSLLIVHPVAALFTLVLVVLSCIAHFHSPARSPRYLLMLLILVLPTFLLSLLAFLVDMLLFVPHVRWGGWLVLAATVMLAVCGIITCAMRRTLASRKSHRKRVAGNAEMNGENYFNQKAATAAATSPPPLSAQPTAPAVDGSTGPDSLPRFATFDMTKEGDGSQGYDERIPLNPRSPPPLIRDGFNGTRRDRSSGMDPAPASFRPPRRADTSSTSTSGRTYADAPDGLGRRLVPPGPHGYGSGSMLRRDPSDFRPVSMLGNAQSPTPHPGAPFPGRGRGGAPPRARDFAGVRGGVWHGPLPEATNSNNRSMASPPPPPPPPPTGTILGGTVGMEVPSGPAPAYAAEYGRSPSADSRPYPMVSPGGIVSPGPRPNLSTRASHGPGPFHPSGGFGGRDPTPGPRFRGPGYMMERGSPGPPPPPSPSTHPGMVVGQAIEMNASTGSPSPSQTPFAPDRASHGYSYGYAGAGLPPVYQADGARLDSGPRSPTGGYSRQETYVPPRAGWNQGHQRSAPPIDLSRPPPMRSEPSPVELPTAEPEGPRQPHRDTDRPSLATGNSYYEDVDPRFVGVDSVQNVAELSASQYSPQGLRPGSDPPPTDTARPHLGQHQSYDELREMARSPAQSETSQYTSVSRGGINPSWQPSAPAGGLGYGTHGSASHQPPAQQRQDVLLAGSADFELPHGAGHDSAGGPISASTATQTPPIVPAAAGGRYP